MSGSPGISKDSLVQYALSDAMAKALQAMLRRSKSGTDRLVLLRDLRLQMGQALTEATLTRGGMEAVAFRAHLAATFATECAKLEADEARQEQR